MIHLFEIFIFVNEKKKQQEKGLSITLVYILHNQHLFLLVK